LYPFFFNKWQSSCHFFKKKVFCSLEVDLTHLWSAWPGSLCWN
jgi:hypothetical protein